MPLKVGFGRAKESLKMRELRTGWARVQLLVLLPFLSLACEGQGPGQRHKMEFRE